METAVEQNRERLKSFDILAGVEALRFDLNFYNRVLPETYQQVKNEQLSFIAEGIDKASRTNFVFERRGEDLVYFDSGKWRPYGEMLQTGFEAAVHDARIDPRRAFLVEWAQQDMFEHNQNKKLAPGESRTWASPYPKDVEERYGKQFVTACGLMPERRMGYIYHATCTESGSVILESQSVDRSDQEAFSAALDAAWSNPSLDLDQITGVYDQNLSRKFGGNFYAGRSGSERNENAWREMLQHYDLIDYLLNGLSALAAKNLEGDSLIDATKRHIYGVWAAFASRLSPQARDDWRLGHKSAGPGVSYLLLAQEVAAAFGNFVRRDSVMIGCGGAIAINGESNLLALDPHEAHSAIFKSKRFGEEVKKCVTCPLCKSQGVDAHVIYNGQQKTIRCSKCKRSKTYRN